MKILYTNDIFKYTFDSYIIENSTFFNIEA